MDGITSQLELIVDDQQVRGLQLPLHQALTMEERQCLESGKQSVPRLVQRERPVGKKLSESLLGIFHHHKQKLVSGELTATAVQQSEQVRMGESGGGAPVGELRLGPRGVTRNELDRGVGKILGLGFGEKHHAVV